MEIRTTCLLMTLCLGIVSVSCEELLHRQKRVWIIDSFKIEEERPGPYPHVLGNINVEKNFRVGFHLHGQGVDLDPKGILSVNTNTGEILVHGKLNYEDHNKLKLTFEARDATNNVVDTRLGVEIEILDINDNPPVFENNLHIINLNESASQGYFLATVNAKDKDKKNTNNGTFDLKIVSITPTPPDDLEFFLQQTGETEGIKFKGCLDHEKSEKYTILVEAKDRGEVVQLSSTCTTIININDGNNHLPVFTGQTGAGSIKERDSGDVPVLRLQVSDQDTKGTEAWKAKYTIHGDKDQNFRITTDPETNEGVLFVQKPLDYEDGSLRNLSVSVENEAPYFSCKVKGRSATGLWDVVTTRGVSLTGLTPPLLPTRQVTVTVEDVNDPPIFTPAIKNVTVEENVEVGWYLETFTAIDLDRKHANTFTYVKGKDPCDCVAIDPKTGKITTTKILDRESPYVKDNVYQVTLFAIDDGQPPMTGTGTLNIHLKDQNDNLPELEMATMDMCLSDEPSEVNITAYDLDGDPYSGPFYFQLQGNDVKGKWRIDPNNGYTVNLVKENTVYAGHHELLLKVFDLQGQGALHNLSVTVCDCSGVANCRMRRATGSKIGESAVGIVIAAMLLLLGFLLLALLMTCKRELKLIPIEVSGEHLIKSNIEIPGTDCKVPMATIVQVDSQMETKAAFQTVKTMSAVQKSASMRAPVRSGYSQYSSSYQEQQHGQFQRGTSLRKSAPTKLRSNGYCGQESMVSRSMKTRIRYSSLEEDHYLNKSGHLMTLMNQRMYTLQVPGEELGDYAPHPYAEEGDLETDLQLDAISIPETPFDQDTLLYLGPRFNTLASICNTPDLSAS
ncbi:cadherin-13 [Coregonus clupeaformis]|uniref:cadherin-13 n=1 Tax=Coregonus clupeaformis TaxID=59861 RepID=UPI001BE0E291|nr:cadherin-13 [Coregonus clupeaformis]